MSFPRLTFPLAVDFGDTAYWAENQGPFKYGAAVTAFFIGEDIAEVSNDGKDQLMNEGAAGGDNITQVFSYVMPPWGALIVRDNAEGNKGKFGV